MLIKALNHMTCPSMRYDDFMRMAKSLGCMGVHYRNDLGRPLFEGDSNEQVRQLADTESMQITGLAQLERFNEWNAERAEQATTLISTAAAIGAAGIGLIPVNDGSGAADGERQANLKAALAELKPLLQAAGIKGFIEPLGFTQCSLRHKAEAVDAIEAVEGQGTFMLVHDTFHHFIANGCATGAPIFPECTGIIEISGVIDPSLGPLDMQDEHRILVDALDRIGNVEQIRELQEAGYTGPVSFEPFSPKVHGLANPAEAIAQSFDFIASELSV